ncbi:MAG TPA: hypothetical protein DEQ30_07455, partial [Porphyromonadaceae bacterium]|nr:hypothetical protein [Porphyromonadaceae bacterium]
LLRFVTKNSFRILICHEITNNSLWVETADGQYRAFIFINTTATNTVTISAKRYKM